ncbi:proprotein convertase P-domain-containing protein [Chroococcus sp. FPU101]|uniref:proprotein convertase P-domain-containing protein n=1 Tax=Chroococcus sp. FPU101 TaxID=1974212 RepID=UPI001A8FEE82|nr:proprotein convertase P-domain-containing protein [Chroococcus sp. FPU101]GFE69595.1 hypothetical protein CFPU101_22050 [Chroococcus sp. FPU101]
MVTIYGNSNNNNLLGTSVNDIIYGYDGNDTLNGGIGADTFYGGKGDDTFIIDNVGDTIVELPGEGVDTVHALINYTLGNYVNHLTLIGTAAINGTGNEYDNVVIGNSGNNIVNGGAGNDRLTGGIGSDSLIGGVGIDQIIETGDFNYTLTNTTLSKTTSNITSTAITANATAYTFTSNTVMTIADYSTITSNLSVSGVSGNISDVDVLININHTWNSDLRVFLINPLGTQIELFTEVGIGGQGFLNTRLDDEASASIASGSGTFTGSFRPKGSLSNFDGTDANGSWKLKITDGAEGDTGTLTSWSLMINGGTTPPPPPPPPPASEVDTLSEIEQANLTGGNSNNRLDATTFSLGAVTVNGGNGNDTLIGGRSNDFLYGGMGNDSLTGGSGADRFIYNAKLEGINQITDFVVVDDTIAVSAAGFGGGLSSSTSISTSQWRVGTAATTSSHRFIYNNTNGSLFFDSDGNGAIAPIQLATLIGNPTLTQSDILVMA